MGRRLLMAFILFLGMVLMALNFFIKINKDNHNEKIKNINNNIESLIFDEVLPLRINEADILSKNVKEEIINIFNKNFEDKTALKRELEMTLSGVVDKSIAFDKMNNIITGRTLNNIKGTDSNGRNKSDRNDLIITIKDPIKGVWLIAIDLSYDCSTEDRVRSKEVEVKKQFSKSLFRKAFEDYTTKSKHVTFWSFAEPIKGSDWYDEVKNFNSTEFDDLKNFFRKYDYNYNSLYSFEILVSNRINDKEDYFQTKYMNYNGSYTKQDMTIIVTSGFNILDQMSLKQMNLLKGYQFEKESEIKTYEIYESISIIIGIFLCLSCFTLFLYSYDFKIKK